jgi:hypothetical protein
MGRGLEELRVSSNGTKHIFTAGKTKGVEFTRGKINSGLVESHNVIVALVHGVNALLVGSGARWKVTDNGAQVSHGGDIKVSTVSKWRNGRVSGESSSAGSGCSRIELSSSLGTVSTRGAGVLRAEEGLRF